MANINIIWKAHGYEYGRQAVDDSESSVSEALVNLLDGAWNTFGDPDDAIYIEKQEDK